MLPVGTVPNTGSNARDFCMLERNLLAHLRLALLLALLSSSLLLRARLVPDSSQQVDNDARLSLSSLEFFAAIASIVAGIWDYHTGCRDLKEMRVFLTSANPHFIIMAVVSCVVFATCIVLLVEQG